MSHSNEFGSYNNTTAGEIADILGNDSDDDEKKPKKKKNNPLTADVAGRIKLNTLHSGEVSWRGMGIKKDAAEQANDRRKFKPGLSLLSGELVVDESKKEDDTKPAPDTREIPLTAPTSAEVEVPIPMHTQSAEMPDRHLAAASESDAYHQTAENAHAEESTEDDDSTHSGSPRQHVRPTAPRTATPSVPVRPTAASRTWPTATSPSLTPTPTPYVRPPSTPSSESFSTSPPAAEAYSEAVPTHTREAMPSTLAPEWHAADHIAAPPEAEASLPHSSHREYIPTPMPPVEANRPVAAESFESSTVASGAEYTVPDGHSTPVHEQQVFAPAPPTEIITHTRNRDPRVPALAAAGLLVAGLGRHSRTKERTARKKADEQLAKVTTTNTEKLQRQVTELQNNQLRTTQELQAAHLQAAQAEQIQRQNRNVAPIPAAVRAPDIVPNQQPAPQATPNYNRPPAPMTQPLTERLFQERPRVEQPRPLQSVETAKPISAQYGVRQEKQPAMPLKAPEKSPATDAQVAIEAALTAAAAAAEQEANTKHIRSEWLDISVDKRTGKTIEKEQGQGYHQERRAEQALVSKSTQKTSKNSDSGSANGIQTSNYATLGTGFSSTALPKYHQDPMLPPGASPPDPQHRLPAAKHQIASNIGNPWFWLIIGIIAIAYFGSSVF